MAAGSDLISSTAAAAAANPPRMTNVFSLVERFTFRHSSSDLDSPNPPPTLPPEIQYWAGVIMRNACRKDESRGGIRQCANSELFLSTLQVPVHDLFLKTLQCYAVVGSHSQENLQNVDGAEKLSTAARNARVRRGVKATVSGAVQKILTRIRNTIMDTAKAHPVQLWAREVLPQR